MKEGMEKITYYENQFIKKFFKRSVMIDNLISVSDCRAPHTHTKIDNSISVSDCRSPRAHTKIVKD